MVKYMKTIELWGIELPIDHLSDSEIRYIQELPDRLPTVNWIWKEMDRIWDAYGLDNKKELNKQDVGIFYKHPVWLVNGLFTSIDEVSRNHREAIATYINKLNVESVADYGGGLAVLAREIAKINKNISIDVIEPFPKRLALFLCEKFGERISFREEVDENNYDLVIAQDVLEHVDDPVGLALSLANKVKYERYVMFANCFYPVIKCHLPKTFHLRHTFKYILQAAGLEYMGRVPGAEHAQVFKKVEKLNTSKARIYENLSKIIGPLLNSLSGPAFKLKNTIINS